MVPFAEWGFGAYYCGMGGIERSFDGPLKQPDIGKAESVDSGLEPLGFEKVPEAMKMLDTAAQNKAIPDNEVLEKMAKVFGRFKEPWNIVLPEFISPALEKHRGTLQ